MEISKRSKTYPLPHYVDEHIRSSGKGSRGQQRFARSKHSFSKVVDTATERLINFIMASDARSSLIRLAVLHGLWLVTGVQGGMWFTTTSSSDHDGGCNKTGGTAAMTEASLSNSTTSTAAAGQSPDTTTIVKQVFLIIAAGVAMSSILLLFTYLQLRYCKNCGISSAAQSSAGTLHHPLGGGRAGRRRPAVDTSLAAQAKLTGMSCQERSDVLEHLFRPYIVDGGEGGSPSHDVEKGGETQVAPSYHTTSRDLESYHNNDDHLWEGDDLPKDASCSICLSTLRKNGRVLETPCKHRFHYKCCQEWLQKRDTCPYCRSDLFTVDQLRSAALEVLGKDRVEHLGADPEGLHKAAELVSNGSAVTSDESAPPEAPAAATPSPPPERRDESV
jgi:Ring finger domain